MSNLSTPSWTSSGRRRCGETGASSSRRLQSRFQLFRLPLPLLLNQCGDQRGPAGLVVGTKAGPVISGEALVEQDVVAPVGIALEDFMCTEDWPPPVLVAQENPNQALGELIGYLPGGQVLSGPRWALDLEVVAVVESVNRSSGVPSQLRQYLQLLCQQIEQ